ncbi:OLC1v1023158C1 [Oldenlandia corymbosa var. corymbosa]|uniref:RING-type E3 ubiquitin transferase n=1 Tax=Oldenlandia corymbosa var. corymbosa TaxID=529605 RepID=A0AAV1C1T0_OLDCO|nr:OLC1v1023158C1 [Oldenlandia corymbosa var. corymbosa]
MGQRNMHMVELEPDRRGQDYIHPEPCIFYGAMTNFPQPSLHAVVPGPVNAGNFNLHHLPEHHDGSLFYNLPQYNQYPGANLDPTIGSSSIPYNPYMAPPCAPRDFPIQVSHGTSDPLCYPSGHVMVGVPTDGYGRANPYLDSIRGSFKRKTAEGLPRNVQHSDALEGSSSSVATVSARPLESDATPTDAVPPELRGNETSSVTESGPNRSLRNRSNVIGPESVMARSPNHSVQPNFVGQPYPVPGTPWLGVDINSFPWNQASTLPYIHGGMEVSNMGLQGYRVAGSSGNFLIPQGRPSFHHQPPHVQGLGHNMNFGSQMVTVPRRFPPNSNVVGPFQGVMETGARYLGPVPPTGFRVYRPPRREVSAEANPRQRNLQHLRVLPEDGVAILEVPGYQEAGDSMDQHREMRLDIDEMSYEELLALGEQIGHVVTGLSEEAIAANMKKRLFTSSSTCSNVDEALSESREVDFCVVCQNDYKVEEEIGTLECGHEYHVDCIKQWLVVKNTCPICKSTALTGEGNGKGKGKDSEC